MERKNNLAAETVDPEKLSAASPIKPNAEYNPIFERLVIEPEGGEVLGVIAYGLYKKAKWEWAQEFWNNNGRPPNEAELKAYIRTWTPSQLQNIRNNAAQVLSEYADTVIEEAKPDIVAKALKGTFTRNLLTNLASAVLYTLILIALAFILSYSGVDLVGIIEKTTPAVSNTPPPAQAPGG